MSSRRSAARPLAAAVAALGLLAGAASGAFAAYPEKPITLVIPYGPGGGTDLAARVLAAEMEKTLGQPVVPTNKGGGGGAVALGGLYSGKPDGYTIALGTASNTAIIPHTTKVAYDALKFTYISTYFDWPYMMVVHPKIPARTVDQLVAWAKANPGELVAVTTGGYNIHEVFIALLASKSGNFEYRTLPTDSAAAGTARVLAGDANFASGSPVTYMKHVQAGSLHPLAIVSDVSTPELEALGLRKMRDSLGFALLNTTVVIAPPGLPEDIRVRLEAAVKKATENPAVIERLNALGLPPVFKPGPEALAITREISDAYGKVIKELMAKK